MATNNQKKLLIALAGQIQAVEDMLQQLYSERGIDTAVGAQLDILGKIVGQLRGGMVDDDYRRMIRARISVNRSKGTIADVVKVATLVVGDDDVRFEVDNQGEATVVLRLMDDAVSDDVASLAMSMLGDTVAGGVRIILEWSSDPVVDWLIWDETDWDDYNWFSSADNS